MRAWVVSYVLVRVRVQSVLQAASSLSSANRLKAKTLSADHQRLMQRSVRIAIAEPLLKQVMQDSADMSRKDAPAPCLINQVVDAWSQRERKLRQEAWAERTKALFVGLCLFLSLL